MGPEPEKGEVPAASEDAQRPTEQSEGLDRLVRRLTWYNDWRRGKDVGMPEPKDISADIDAAIRIIDRVHMWSEFSDAEMRLHAGEMTAQEIRSVRAILGCIYA